MSATIRLQRSVAFGRGTLRARTLLGIFACYCRTVPPAVPESGDLEISSAVRLYALAALDSASGWLQLELEERRMLQISFRRGTPEHLGSDHPELSLLRFLQSREVISAAQ